MNNSKAPGMKAVILAGGLGTRLSEETQLKPKPMVDIGGKPILWHIMKLYSYYGINDFIICLGYKGYVIKEYFRNYHMHMCDVTIDIKENKYNYHENYAEPWKVTLVETGQNTMTGGRLKRIENYLKDEEQFCLTYGDGVADVDVGALVDFHKNHGKLATLTAVQPPERFGVLDFDQDGETVRAFKEKVQKKDVYINGGFFVLSPKVLDYISDDSMPWEKEPLEKIAEEGELKAFRHKGYWQCMDTLRDKMTLDNLWKQNKAPWRLWD
jgi:glucose-1-phosphate cytidylyltransferase